MKSQDNLSELLSLIVPHVYEAGEISLQADHRVLGVSKKADGSPVTPMDEELEAFLTQKIRNVSDYPIVGEEAVANKTADRIEDKEAPFWLIDAIDGTKAYIAGRSDYTINIALVEAGQPVLGIIYAPKMQELFYASRNNGAFMSKGQGNSRGLSVEPHEGNALTVVAGPRVDLKGRVARYFDQIPYDMGEVLSYHSSYKLCVLAMGKADVYPRFGPISEWDIAAGHCILEEAGGQLVHAHTGENILYANQENDFRQSSFIASRKGIVTK